MTQSHTHRSQRKSLLQCVCWRQFIFRYPEKVNSETISNAQSRVSVDFFCMCAFGWYYSMFASGTPSTRTSTTNGSLSGRRKKRSFEVSDAYLLWTLRHASRYRQRQTQNTHRAQKRRRTALRLSKDCSVQHQHQHQHQP